MYNAILSLYAAIHVAKSINEQTSKI